MIALRRQAAVHRAGTHRDQDLAVLAKLAQYMNVVGIADPALDESDIAGTAVLDVGERRAVELDTLEQLEQPLVDIEQRHVAAETAGQRSGRDTQLGLCGIVHVESSFPAVGRRGASSSACGADRLPIEAPFADGDPEPDALAQDHAYRADVHGLVGDGDIGVGEPPGFGVDDEVLGDAAPRQRKHVLAIDLRRGAHAQLAQDAAIEIEQDLGVRGIDRSVREQVVEARPT